MNYHSIVELLEGHSETAGQSQGDSDSINEVDKVNNEQTTS